MLGGADPLGQGQRCRARYGTEIRLDWAAGAAGYYAVAGKDETIREGLKDMGDIDALLTHHSAGISGVISGKALYDGRLDPTAALEKLRS